MNEWMKSWLLNRNWYWSKQKELSLDVEFYFFCYIYPKFRYLRVFLSKSSILFPVLHNLFEKHQFTVKHEKLSNYIEERTDHFISLNYLDSAMKYGN